MKIQNLDEVSKTTTRVIWDKRVIARVEEWYWIIKYINRIKKAYAVLKWDADAFTYSEQKYQW